VNVNLEELVPAAQQGDDGAFYQLIHNHREKLYKVAYAFLRNETDALEAIQETTCRAYLKLSQIKQPAYFTTWLTRILIHVCIDEQKRKKRWLVDTEERAQAHGSNFESHADERFELEEALTRLAPTLRHVIILKYFEDLTIRKIASMLRCGGEGMEGWLFMGERRHG
jgi:RNA polymerase sigma factor (sigma-70 family)